MVDYSHYYLLFTVHSCRTDAYFTLRRGPGAAARQAAELRREGVTVVTGNMGELSVDFGACGWFPSMLPSEEADASASESESGSGSG